MSRLIALLCSVAAAVSFAGSAAAAVVFDAQSTATQTISSPLFGGSATITATGTQTFTLDLVGSAANVISDFKGTDLPDPLNPGGFLDYDLYNTATIGTVTVVPHGYDVNFEVLFELKVTSGPFTGLTFETQQQATFFTPEAHSLPFPGGTLFADPTPPDLVNIYVKIDPTGNLPAGSLVGASFDRTVTVGSAVPEPSSMALVIAALVIAGLACSIASWRAQKATPAKRLTATGCAAI
jgi:hypothetical protein